MPAVVPAKVLVHAGLVSEDKGLQKSAVVAAAIREFRFSTGVASSSKKVFTWVYEHLLSAKGFVYVKKCYLQVWSCCIYFRKWQLQAVITYCRTSLSNPDSPWEKSCFSESPSDGSFDWQALLQSGHV